MTKPLNHASELLSIAIDQLRAQFPSASGDVIRARAKTLTFPQRYGTARYGGKLEDFMAQLRNADVPDHGKGEF